MSDKDTITGDPILAEQNARLRLQPFWEHIGTSGEADYPISTSAVLSFVTQLDYDADGDFVLGLVNAGTIPVPRVGGKFAWSALDLYQLVLQLEGRRRWKMSPLHLPKMTAMERAELEARSEGRGTAFTDLDAFDLEALLHLMQDADQWHTRHACLLAIQAKLRSGETL